MAIKHGEGHLALTMFTVPLSLWGGELSILVFCREVTVHVEIGVQAPTACLSTGCIQAGERRHSDD